MDVEGRQLPDPAPGDRDVLVQWLHWQRATVVAKCEGLDETWARARLVPTSPLTISGVVEDYQAQCAASRRIAAADELDAREQWCPEGLPRVTLRWILGHLVQETARHLGHLDLLCENADGRRGY